MENKTDPNETVINQHIPSKNQSCDGYIFTAEKIYYPKNLNRVEEEVYIRRVQRGVTIRNH